MLKEQTEYRQPAYIFLSACLHFLSFHDDINAEELKEWFKDNKILLEAINGRTDTKVVWLKQNHINGTKLDQSQQLYGRTFGSITPVNVQLYNDLYEKEFRNSSVILMTSAAEIADMVGDFMHKQPMHVGRKTLKHQANLLVNILCKELRYNS